MVDHKFGNDTQAPLVGLLDETANVPHPSVFGMHTAIFRDVVAVIAPRRWIEGEKPDRRDADLRDVIEAGNKTGKISDAVVVGVKKRLHVKLIYDRILVPERVARLSRFTRPARIRLLH